MRTIFILNTIVSFFIFGTCLIGFFKHYKNNRTNRVVNYLSIIGLFYLFFSIFSFNWAFGFLNYSKNDFLYVYCFLIFLKTIFIMLILGVFNTKKSIYYLFFAYLLPVFLFIFFGNLGALIILEFSFLFNLFLFLGFSFRKDEYRKIGYLGIFYFIVSLIFFILVIFNYGEPYVFSFFSNFVFLFLVIVFLRDLNQFPIPIKYPKQEHYLLSFFRYFIFIVLLTNILFISAIFLHETGHFIFSKIYGCNYSNIVYYGGSLPHTESICPSKSAGIFSTIGGIIFPIVLAGIIYLIGGKFLRDLSLLILGFNLVISSKDFLDLGFSANIITAFNFLGIVCIIIGIVLLAKSRIEEYTLF